MKPTNSWNIPTYTVYQTDGPRPPRGGRDTVLRSSIEHNKVNLPQLTALEATVFNRDASGSVCAPPSRQLLVQDLAILTTYKHQHFIFAGDYNAKHQIWHSGLTTISSRTLHNHALQNYFDAMEPHTPTHFLWNYNRGPGMLETAITKTSAVPVNIESREALSSERSPVTHHGPATTWIT
jgi:hypothetical protein